MKKDRELLENNLAEVLDQVKHKRKDIEAINSELNEYNVPVGTLNSIITGHTSFNTLDLALLCLITLAVYKVTNNNSISPYDFFTENEINTSKRYEGFKKKEITLPITFENVIMMDYESYITKVKMSLLVEMQHSKLIIYNYETQRSAKYKRVKDAVIPTPDVNKKSVKDISEHMINQTYLPDMITLNAYSDEVESLTYDEKNKTLTINEGAVISILDGFHRLQAGVRAVSLNPDLELEMILSIRSYDIETAKKYFGQINTINPIKPERLRELKSERHSDIVIKNLQKKSDLKGKIASASNISEIANQLTTFDILSFAVDDVFHPTTSLEAREISDYLIDFFNYLVGHYVDEFLINPNEYRKTYINHPLMFAGYVQIAKKMQDEGRPLKEIKEVIEKIDFSDTKLIEILTDKKGINNKRNRRSIIEYFKK